MLRPIWNTPSGLLTTVVAGVNVSFTLDVTNASAVEVISKSLPDGLKLISSTKTISGIPRDTGIDKTYEFVIRASNTTGANNSKIIQDRTFSIVVTSDSKPVLLDPEGTLSLINVNENYVLNKSTISYQFTASATSIPTGQQLKFYIEEGAGQLPPGLKLSPDGLLYGTIDDDVNLDYKVVQGTYDRDYYDINPYDYSSSIESAKASVTVNGGKISTAIIEYGGNGYLLDPDIIIGGSINTILIDNKGSGYTTAPDVVFSLSPTPGGITATGKVIMESDGAGALRVSGIVITHPGTGYVTPPRITFKNQNTGSGAEASCNLRSGSGAEIVARVSNGTVTILDIIDTGSGYSTPPIISFGLPTAGAKIISRVYKFAVTVSNGEEFDTKQYTILVKSEDSLRVDTTFISSDTLDFDTSKTYVQSPIWISPSVLPTIKGDNNYIYNLEVFDPTPSIGKIYFSLMDVNFDGTESIFGPADEIKNAVGYTITSVNLTLPAEITLSQPRVFQDGDRIKLTNISGTTQLNDGVFYVKVVDVFTYQLYSDKLLINAIDALLYSPYTGVGYAHFQSNYLTLDPDGGEISGFIPYQPSITKTYNFTVKSVRVIDDAEVASVFKQFELTVKGNIDGEITFNSSELLGSIKPNEQSLFNIVATSTIPGSSIVYSSIPGYGRTSKSNYVELDFTEQNGNIYIDGYGTNPIITFEKGQTYKINVSLSNFTMSFRNSDDTYYNTGIRHSSGSVETAAQEKSNGYYIFTPPFGDTTSVRIHYKNIKRDGLIVALKKYNESTSKWERLDLPVVYNDYDANTYYERELFDRVERTPGSNLYNLIPNGSSALAVYLDNTKVQIQIKAYNPNTFVWEKQIFPTVAPAIPKNGDYWIDLSETNFGLLDFRYVGLKGIWTAMSPTVVDSVPLNSTGTNYSFVILNDNGIFKAMRKSNNIWKYLERLPYGVKGAYDPNVYFTTHTHSNPITNLQHDVWFKYTSLYDGKDSTIISNLKSLDSLPTELIVSLDGEIVGRISPNTGSTYRSYYTINRLYLINDVITVDDLLYICINQYRSSGNWISEITNWQPYFFPKRVVTSFDLNSTSSSKFSVAGTNGNDGTSIDKLFRFRVRAKDTQNVGYVDKDFNIDYISSSNTTLTNIYLQPFLTKDGRNQYFNFITDPMIFPQSSIYRSEDKNFGVQRIPKMLLLGGIENTTAERYASAVQRNYYDRPLYFGDIKIAIAKKDNIIQYEVVYVEINDPYEIDGVSVSESIKLDFEYALLTTDYTKLRVDDNAVIVPSIDNLNTVDPAHPDVLVPPLPSIYREDATITTDTYSHGTNTIFPSSITLMQKGIENVSSQKTESILVPPTYDGPYIGTEPQGWGTISILDPVSSSEDWGMINERVAIIDDFLSVIETLVKDEKYRPLWMNTSQDGTGNIIGYVKAVPICYLKPGEGTKILESIKKSNFDFKSLNFTIDRIIIQNPQGDTGDKYIKFINREII